MVMCREGGNTHGWGVGGGGINMGCMSIQGIGSFPRTVSGLTLEN